MAVTRSDIVSAIRRLPSVVSGGGEMVDAGALKSPVRKDMWVRVPPLAWNKRRASSAKRQGDSDTDNTSLPRSTLRALHLSLMSEFYSLRRNAITDISAFFGFVIGFLGSSPIAYPYLQVGFQTQEIVKGFAWFIGITFGSGVLLGIAGLGVGRAHRLALGELAQGRQAREGAGVRDRRRAIARARARYQQFVPVVPAACPADVAQPSIRYAAGVDARGLAELIARSGVGTMDVARLEKAMTHTTNIGAWDGTRLVGALRLLSDGYEWSVVTDIIVDPEYRRRGIGRELMQRAAEACRQASSPSPEFLPAPRDSSAGSTRFLHTMDSCAGQNRDCNRAFVTPSVALALEPKPVMFRLTPPA